MSARRVIIGVALLAVVAAGGYGLYSLGMHRGMSMAPATSIAPPAAGQQPPAAGERKVLYWHDPMVPGQRFDKPGKSPFMDMQLVPVYADEAGTAGLVTISPRVQQNLGVRTAEVTRGTVGSATSAVGSVAWDDRDVAIVQARSNGFVERLHVRAPLDPVKKDQPLVDLYVPDWVAAQEEFFTVRRMQGRDVAPLLDGARQRMRLAGMSDAQIRAIEASGTVQPRLTITAPIGGVVTELTVREGMTVAAGTSLFRINGIGTIWVNADVPEIAAALVRPGADVIVSAPALAGRTLKGRVSRILPELNAQTRTIKARIELSNPSGQLAPGMFVTVSFSGGERSDVLLVPTEAVIQTGRRTVVIAALGDGRFAPVDVEIGAEAGGQTEIRKGLSAGQKVVVSGQFLIDSEASLKAALDRMGETPVPRGDTAKAPAAAGIHRGDAKVEKTGNDEVILSHGPIPSLKWPPMTMGFKLPPTGLPKGVEVGGDVQFEFRETKNGAYEITSMTPAPGAKR